MKSKPSTTLVYSTETGRICPDCSQPVAQCQCAANKRALAAASVTLVRGLALDAAALAALGKQLKAACGSGGTAKDGVIEVQGDHVATVMAALGKLGYAVKRSGG
jgi:translation initiation factor 1